MEKKGAFPYCKRRKAGQGLGTRLWLCAISRQLPGPQSSTCTGRLVLNTSKVVYTYWYLILMHTVCAFKALSVHYRKFSSEHMPGGFVYRWLLADFSCQQLPGVKPRTPLTWATSALPLSHDSQTTTYPHNHTTAQVVLTVSVAHLAAIPHVLAFSLIYFQQEARHSEQDS